MKYKILFLICSFFFVSCVSKVKKKCNLGLYSIEYCKLHVCKMDTGLVCPQSINVFKDKLLVMEPQKGISKISVFDRKRFAFLFSGIDEGRAKHEVVNLRNDYYAYTDTSFFVLDNNIEKEYSLHDNHISYIGYVPIVIPDAINQLLRIGEEKYITSGFTSGEGHEHLLCDKGKYEGFGEYPELYSSPNKTFVLNAKVSAGMTGKERIWDFYLNHNLIRSYDLYGNLLAEIEIENAVQKTRIADPQDCTFYFYDVKWNGDYIAVLYNEKYSWMEFYLSDNVEQRMHELQLWTWDGELKRRIRFDKHFDFYALSEDNIFYAMDDEQPNVIYTYDFEDEHCRRNSANGGR